jgi:transketolase
MTVKQENERVKKTIIETCRKYKLGHVGSCFSCADILSVLFFKVMRRSDRFVMGKGHAAVALYAVWKEMGYLTDVNMEILSEHVDKNINIGSFCTTGSLGMGLPFAVGMAKGGKRTYCLMSDGELDEGSNWEAARLACDLKLSNLVAIIDANGFQAYKRTDYESIIKKFNAFGWAVKEAQGHNLWNMTESFMLNGIDCPIAIVCKTIKGKGMGKYEGKLSSHYVTI